MSEQPSTQPDFSKPAEIFSSLRSKTCPHCTGPKPPGKSFCRPDYMALPKYLQNGLYDAQGYAETFRAALDHLKEKRPV